MRKKIIVVIVSILLFASTLSVLMVAAEPGAPYGGRLKAGFTEDMVESLNIGKSMYQTYDSGCVLWPLIYDQLWILGPAPDYAILPMLATHWEVENGGKTWIFHLHENAKWHDGENVTAEDVAYTFTELPQEEPWWYPDCDCEIATVIDTYTVNITLYNPV